MQKAQRCLTYADVLGKRLTDFNTYLSVDEAKRALGLGSVAFEDVSYFAKAGEAGSYSVSSSDFQLLNKRIVQLEANVRNKSKDFVAKINAYNGETISPYIKLITYEYMSGKEVNINLDETEVFNYVSDNMWETYTA